MKDKKHAVYASGFNFIPHPSAFILAFHRSVTNLKHPVVKERKIACFESSSIFSECKITKVSSEHDLM